MNGEGWCGRCTVYGVRCTLYDFIFYFDFLGVGRCFFLDVFLFLNFMTALEWVVLCILWITYIRSLTYFIYLCISSVFMVMKELAAIKLLGWLLYSTELNIISLYHSTMCSHSSVIFSTDT